MEKIHEYDSNRIRFRLDTTEARIIARIDHRAYLLELSHLLSFSYQNQNKNQILEKLQKFRTAFSLSKAHIRNSDKLEQMVEAILFRLGRVPEEVFTLETGRYMGLLRLVLLDMYENGKISQKTQADFIACMRDGDFMVEAG